MLQQDLSATASTMQYFVVMIDYGRRGREAIVDPEITRREVIARVSSGEYSNVSFIHEIVGSSVADVTADILAEATPIEIEFEGVDLQAIRFDHNHDLRKHGVDCYPDWDERDSREPDSNVVKMK